MSKKTEKKKQEKVIQDRTFGLKNKNKSKAVQKFIKGVQTTVKHQGVALSKLEADQHERKKMKKKAQEEAALLSSLYKDVNRLKDFDDSDDEQDPANIVCPYFKQGLCQKGKKCIYSHDLTLDRTEEIDLYVDQRTQLIMNAIGGKQLSQLSQDQLTKMIGEKQREMMKGCRSDIAVEKDKYGWNWSCPNNGDRCKYKHCLPPGYKLRKDGGKIQIEEQQVNVEQKIDQERNKLLSQNRSSPLVSFEVFMQWKQDRRKRKEAEAAKKKQIEEKKAKNKGVLRTGKQLFTYDPTLFIDDQEAADDYEKQEIIEQQEQEEKKQRIRGSDDEEEDIQKIQETKQQGIQYEQQA